MENFNGHCGAKAASDHSKQVSCKEGQHGSESFSANDKIYAGSLQCACCVH